MAQDTVAPRSCVECGARLAESPGARPGRPQRFCSYSCGREHRLRRRRETEYVPAARICDLCGGQIPYKSGKRRYCSAECQKAGVAREARWRVKGLPPNIVVADACQLCGAADRRLVIDHDHDCCPKNRACGKCFRGMLCQPCNVALGMFREDVDLIRRAAEYIEKTKALHSI